MSLTKVSYSMITGAEVSVMDFGAAADGVTDDTQAFNAAITSLGTAGGVVYAKPGATHYIAQNPGILIPSNVTLDLQGATIKGTGNVSTQNVAVRSAYYNAGVLTPNTSANALNGTRVRNGTFFRCGTAMHLQSCIDACKFENLYFTECYNGLYANFCLYANFENIMYRNANGGYGFQFQNNCNAITLKNLYVIGQPGAFTETGFVFNSSTYNVNMLNCSTEYCATGILTEEVNQFVIDGHYFEEVSLAINLQGSSFRKTGVEVRSCFFSACADLVSGATVDGFYWNAANQRFSNCVPGRLMLPTDVTYPAASALAVCTGVIELVQTTTTPTSVGIPSWMVLSDGLDLRLVVNASVSGSGFGTPIYAKALVHTGANEGVVPFNYSGGSSAVSGTVPFCVVAIPTGASVTATVTSRINAAGQSMCIFWLLLVDNSGSRTFQGRCYGTNVFMDSALPAGYTVSVTSTGYLVLNIAGVNNTSGTATLTGQFRHI